MNAAAPFIPDSAPFSPEQRAWLNGFLAGLFSRQPAGADSSRPSASAPALVPLTILFGSQTGTAESLAKKAAKEAGQRGFAAAVLDLASCSVEKLAQEKNALLITSTYGDGEPPDNARAFHAAALAATGSPLAALRFSLCALGDTNYEKFCQCGRDLDAAFEKLGATRAAPRADCDVDFDASFSAWLDAALTALNSAPTSAPTPKLVTPHSSLVTPTAYGRANPFPAPVLAIRRLNAAGSAKEVNHVEFSLKGSGLVYEAGDALAVRPQNCPELVAAILAALGSDGEEAVPSPVGDLPLRLALTAHYDLGKPTADLLKALGLTPSPGIHDVLDALSAIDASNLKSRISNPSAFIALLRKLQPRLYSISSSPKAHPDQVHLTVGAVRYDHAGRRRKGACSTFLAERALATGTVGVFVHSNKAFRPPADPAAPMIMIGPGTGIAPFRAFLQERVATAATGKNWLFFGDQRAATDFLYREQLKGWIADSRLHRLDTAFSRDQAEKIYVQHRMLENAAELWSWLEAGAHFYVCGDAQRMAKDVDAALHRVIEIAGGKSPLEAAAYVQALKSTKRYARDVY